jgi:hypothetical protein
MINPAVIFSDRNSQYANKPFGDYAYVSRDSRIHDESHYRALKKNTPTGKLLTYKRKRHPGSFHQEAGKGSSFQEFV